jgi:hypothetical protein
VVLIEGIHQLTIDDTPAEIPSATELVYEVSLMCVEVVDSLSEQRDELGLRLTEEKMPTTVEVRYGIHLDVSERLTSVSLVSRDDVSVQSPVVSLGLAARVIHAGADGRELDRSAHHLAGTMVEATEQIKNHTALAVIVVEAVAFWVVASVEIAGVYIVLTKVRVRLTRVARGRAVLLDDPLHAVSEPPR